jgi:hypothetical protein
MHLIIASDHLLQSVIGIAAGGLLALIIKPLTDEKE